MKTIKNILIIGAVLLASCTKEQQPENVTPDPAGSIVIDLTSGEGGQGGVSSANGAKTRAGIQTSDEMIIKSVDVFFYDADDKLVKRFSTGSDGVTVNDSKIIIPGTLVDTKQSYNIVVVANRGTSFGVDDIAKETNLSVLMDKITTITAPIEAPTEAKPLLMSGYVADHNFSQKPVATVDLVRQVVRFDFTVTMKGTFTAAYPDAVFGGAAGETMLSVLNVPNKSYVMVQTTPVIPTGSVMIDYAATATTKNGDAWKLTLYAYENPQTGATDAVKRVATQFILKLPYALSADGAVVANNFYKIYINDPLDATNPHKTLRNNRYKVDVTVSGFGSELPAIDGTEVATTVLPWAAEHSQDDPVGEYLIVDKTVKTLKYNFKQVINIKASDFKKVVISSKNGKLDWTNNEDGTIEVWVKQDVANLNDEPVADFDELIITLGKYTEMVPINYRPSMAQCFAPGNLVLTADGKNITIGNPTEPQNNALIFKWGTTIGMKVRDNSGNILTKAEVVYKPVGLTGISGINNPIDISVPVPKPLTESAYIGKDKDYYEYLESQSNLVNQGYGDPCRRMGKVDDKFWRTPTGAEWQELIDESTKQDNGSFGNAKGFNGYEPRESGTSSDMNPNADYGWFFGPTAGVQTDAAVPTKGSIFIYQRYYGTSGYANINNPPTLNLSTSSALDATKFHYYTANDVNGGMKTQTIIEHVFAVRCIRDFSRK